jgi:hypothetical protein
MALRRWGEGERSSRRFTSDKLRLPVFGRKQRECYGSGEIRLVLESYNFMTLLLDEFGGWRDTDSSLTL